MPLLRLLANDSPVPLGVMVLSLGRYTPVCARASRSYDTGSPQSGQKTGRSLSQLSDFLLQAKHLGSALAKTRLKNLPCWMLLITSSSSVRLIVFMFTSVGLDTTIIYTLKRKLQIGRTSFLKGIRLDAKTFNAFAGQAVAATKKPPPGIAPETVAGFGGGFYSPDLPRP